MLDNMEMEYDREWNVTDIHCYPKKELGCIRYLVVWPDIDKVDMDVGVVVHTQLWNSRDGICRTETKARIC